MFGRVTTGFGHVDATINHVLYCINRKSTRTSKVLAVRTLLLHSTRSDVRICFHWGHLRGGGGGGGRERAVYETKQNRKENITGTKDLERVNYRNVEH